MSYSTVFVDWHGTLSNSHFWERWIKDKAMHDWYSLVNSALFENHNGMLLIEDWMRGTQSSTNVLQYLYDVTAIPLIELESELHYSAEHMAFINQDILPKVQNLRSKGIKVVIASDNMDIFRLVTIKALHLENIFDAIITSDTQGALKADTNADGSSPFFDSYLYQNRIQPGDAVLIDDTKELEIIKRQGIDFLHVTESMSLEDYLDMLIAETNNHQ